MAMVVLNIGILAIVASFNSGAFALQSREPHLDGRGARRLADRALPRASLFADRLHSSQIAGLDNTYKCDSVARRLLSEHCHRLLAAATCADGTEPTFTCGTANECLPRRTVNSSSTPPSPDRYPYRVDTYILYKTPTGGRQLKQITVVVRDGNNLARTFARDHVDVRPDREQLTPA